MSISGFFILFLLLTSTLAISVNGHQANAASTNIIINEVELNTPADDRLSSDGVMEQVELYNPTTSPIDISNWKVSSTHGDTVTLTIPGAMVLMPGDYRLIGQDAQWLDDVDEMVILKNPNNVQIDSTGLLNDANNDARSWQRYPNSGNTWLFRQSTLGLTNGPGDFALSASPNTLVLAPASSITSTITVSPLNGYSGTVTFFISGLPAGTTGVFTPSSINVGGAASSTSTLGITTSANTPAGMYKLIIAATDSSTTVHTTSISLTVTPLNIITHMSDTTASSGRALYSALSIRGEYATATSQLVGDNIDQITMRLAKVGTPTGNAVIGVFDASGNVKKQFGVKDVATIGSTYSDYTFSLGNSELYTIQSGDRIGIKYLDGSSSNYVNVMVDSNAADPFDGANSYRQWFTTSWQSLTGEDMYMILRQSHAAPKVTVHMEDTTASSGRQLYSALSARAEYVSPTSQLIGDKIDQITMRLARVGTPTSNAAIGIFDSLGNLKKLFGSQNVASVGTTYSDYTYSLSSNDSYIIQSGDRIGIKYLGGSSTNYINVMVDSNAADPFDGTNSYRQWFTTSWQSLTAEDMYMILKQTH